MYRLLIFISILFILSCQNAPKQAVVKPEWKEIPAKWIEKAKLATYTETDSVLVADFIKIVPTDSTFESKEDHSSLRSGFVFSVISADLDGDSLNELLCLQGWNTYAPYLTVFKQANGKWYLIYLEQIHTFYEEPVLGLAGNFSKSKTFYLRRVTNHGSGIYTDFYSFYKLDNDVVYQSLNIVNDAHIYGWGLYLNQEVTSHFEFSGHRDALEVRYYYNFFPGAINQEDCSWCANEDISLIKGDDRVYYNYDTKEHRYKLDTVRGQNEPEDLTEKKIAYFGDFFNDSLFVAAFDKHINKVLKGGTPQQKQILKNYLTRYEKEKKVRTEELEVKSKAGNTNFYGPKKK